MPNKIKTQKHLINIIAETRDHHPNFILLLGAGASKTSGVKSSKEMVQDWREKYITLNEKGDEFLKKQSWYNRAEEYGALFETHFDQASQRREYIESCLKKAKPSWGYIYLVNLLRLNVFNTVFTTNFDDLMNEACYLFSNDVRPLVCAHDSSVRTLRITSQRPKIIKLHGDFLFDNIKNTVLEVDSLESNMREKFRQYAPEFGMIVVGYSGNDRSIMDNIDSLLRTETSFPHGIYWCVLNESDISERVQSLTRFPKFHIVIIGGFDELFAEINNSLELDLQSEMIDPYKALTLRLNALVEMVKIPEEPSKIHPVIKKDIEKLSDKIKTQTSDKNATPQTGFENESTMPTPPFQLLAEVAFRNEQYEEAKQFAKSQIQVLPDDSVYRMATRLLMAKWDDSFANTLLDSIRKNPTLIEPVSSIAVDLISMKKYDLAIEVLNIGFENYKNWQAKPAYIEEFHKLNLFQIKVHKGESLTTDETIEIENIAKSENEMSKMGASILLGNYSNAIKIIQKYADPVMLEWPIIKLIPSRFNHEIDKIKSSVVKK